MKTNLSKGAITLRSVLAVILFSLFLKFDSLFSLMNTLAESGWSLLPIIMVAVLIRMLFAGSVVLFVLPLCLGCKNWRVWLPTYLRLNRQTILLGILSFAIFGILALVISTSLGIFQGNPMTVLAYPDLRPDPDVVGWGYFLLALIPGIWEELAFRGLFLSKLRTVFSIRLSILLSALFFALFHFSNLVTQSFGQVIFGVIMAFLFGIGWGFMTVKARSVIPAMISHYLVDSLGQIFLSVDSTDPALATMFFILLTLLFPVFNIVLTKLIYREQVSKEKTVLISKKLGLS